MSLETSQTYKSHDSLRGAALSVGRYHRKRATRRRSNQAEWLTRNQKSYSPKYYANNSTQSAFIPSTLRWVRGGGINPPKAASAALFLRLRMRIFAPQTRCLMIRWSGSREEWKGLFEDLRAKVEEHEGVFGEGLIIGAMQDGRDSSDGWNRGGFQANTQTSAL